MLGLLCNAGDAGAGAEQWAGSGAEAEAWGCCWGLLRRAAM